MHKTSIDQAPNLPDSTLDQIVSSINVEREEIGPHRYIADLGILFDRARAAPFLGVEGGEISRSQPMLLIPITVSEGPRPASNRATRGSGPGPSSARRKARSIMCGSAAWGWDPMLVNAAQTVRPGRGWWRDLIDLYGAADILVAEVQLQRPIPAGRRRPIHRPAWPDKKSSAASA